MKLATKIAIDYSAGIGSIGNEIVECDIHAKVFNPDGSITVCYTYQVNGQIVKEGCFEIPSEDFQSLWDDVKSGLPDPDTQIGLNLETAFYKMLVPVMVLEFDAIVDDTGIEII